MNVNGQMREAQVEFFVADDLPLPSIPFRIIWNQETGTMQIAYDSAWNSYPKSTDLLPIGTILPYAGVPQNGNWLPLNGSVVQQLDWLELRDFAILAGWFTDLGTPGDFFIPTTNGLMHRALDPSGTIDPNYSSRSEQVPGTKIFSLQEDTFESHSHSYTISGSTACQEDGGQDSYRGDSFTGQTSGGASGGNIGPQTNSKNLYTQFYIKGRN